MERELQKVRRVIVQGPTHSHDEIAKFRKKKKLPMAALAKSLRKRS